jgi:hypothetical protein
MHLLWYMVDGITWLMHGIQVGTWLRHISCDGMW